MKIVAVMVTGKDPSRRRLALQSVRSFREQRRPFDSDPAIDYKLLIINDSGEDWCLRKAAKQDMVEEIMLPHDPNRTLGDLRNEAFNHVNPTDIMIQWDDDDYSHSDRIAIQYGDYLRNGTNILRYEVVHDLEKGERTFVLDANRWPRGGFPGTIMHAASTLHRYPSLGAREDSMFLKKFIDVHAIDNVPDLYIRFVHGNNTWPKSHLMNRVGQELENNKFVECTIEQYKTALS